MTDALAGKRLVILGLARQGVALARFAATVGAQVVISDLRPATQLVESRQQLADLEIEYVLGEHPMSLLDGADILAVSGGVPLDTPLVQAARARGVTLTNDSQEFMFRAPATVIGITGSAGKTTTTALTGLMGQLAGRRTWIGGNIGRPLLVDLPQMGPDDLVVQELSSFQLDLWTQSPPVAAVLNITPNHLDRHGSMAAYTEAKARIVRFQDVADVAVLCADDAGSMALRPLVRGRLRLFSQTRPVADGAFVRADAIWLRDAQGRERAVAPLAAIRLRGRHNILNVLAAVTLADSVGLPASAMAGAIAKFTGVAHRLEHVATVAGVRYVNDSIATAPERALAALAAFDAPVVLLAGGRDKEMAWEAWARQVSRRTRHVVLFGELAGTLETRLRAEGYVDLTRVETLAQAVAAAAAAAHPGDVVLLAPGGTSFDAFPDFAARGEQFRLLVRELQKE